MKNKKITKLNYMKTVITVIFTFFLTTACGQPDNCKTVLDSAKVLFQSESNLSQEEFDRFDYYPIVSMLEKAIELNPKDAEARYFLGYTYSRINSRDGRSMIDMDLELLYKTSEQFEKVIELEPKYTGEIIVLDPYAKQTAEWGAMAMGYWFNNKTDSAIWAFKEGKKRYGFGDFVLEFHKKVLDACSENAILISSGDITIFSLWYLQIVENYRTDVTIVEINLLNTKWYPAFLSKNKSVVFDLPDDVLDTIEYAKWTDTIITINDFSWTVKPSYYDQYLLRGDKVFLSLLNGNKFQKELFFTTGFEEERRLSLKEYLLPLMIVDKLSVSDKNLPSFENDETKISEILNLSKHLNLNSSGERNIFDIYRYHILMKVNDFLNNNDNEKAKKFMELLDKFANDKEYPYLNEKWNEYVDYLRQKI